MTSVIIVDDHELFRMGMKAMLASKEGILVAGEAGSGEELFLLLQSTTADVVLLDIIMPGMNGVEIARLLKKKYPAMKILILSSENSRDVIGDLMEAGIDGFISKQRSEGENELAEAIRSVASGLEYYGKDISALLYRVYVSIKKRTEITAEFTDREREIILLCRDGLLSKEIADRLCISPRTVDTHKTNIFSKLGIKNMKEVVRYALEHGIID
jgi:DNA-binding NarL/FixJ family response regulator